MQDSVHLSLSMGFVSFLSSSLVLNDIFFCRGQSKQRLSQLFVLLEALGSHLILDLIPASCFFLRGRQSLSLSLHRMTWIPFPEFGHWERQRSRQHSSHTWQWRWKRERDKCLGAKSKGRIYWAKREYWLSRESGEESNTMNSRGCSFLIFSHPSFWRGFNHHKREKEMGKKNEKQKVQMHDTLSNTSLTITTLGQNTYSLKRKRRARETDRHWQEKEREKNSTWTTSWTDLISHILCPSLDIIRRNQN